MNELEKEVEKLQKTLSSVVDEIDNMQRSVKDLRDLQDEIEDSMYYIKREIDELKKASVKEVQE